MSKKTFSCIAQVRSLGISEDDAWSLRRISMTLHRWHELNAAPIPDVSSAMKPPSAHIGSMPCPAGATLRQTVRQAHAIGLHASWVNIPACRHMCRAIRADVRSTSCGPVMCQKAKTQMLTIRVGSQSTNDRTPYRVRYGRNYGRASSVLHDLAKEPRPTV